MYVCINIYIYTYIYIYTSYFMEICIYIYMRIIFKSYVRQLSYHRICPFAHHLWFSGSRYRIWTAPAQCASNYGSNTAPYLTKHVPFGKQRRVVSTLKDFDMIQESWPPIHSPSMTQWDGIPVESPTKEPVAAHQQKGHTSGRGWRS